jgi:hypothetical protein
MTPAVSEEMLERERQAFEAWAATEWTNGQFPPTHAWTGWLARAAAALSQPQGELREAPTDLAVEWRRRIKAIGRDTGGYRQCADELDAALAGRTAG